MTIGGGVDEVVFTLSDGKTYHHTITPALKEAWLPPPVTDQPDPEDISRALSAVRDAFKPADKKIGVALRHLKKTSESLEVTGGDEICMDPN